MDHNTPSQPSTTQSATAPASQPQRLGGALPDWPAFQRGGAMLGQADPIAAPPMHVRWTFKAEGGFDAPAAIVGPTVYIADHATDGQSHLYALDLVSGQPRWTYDSKAGFATAPLVVGGLVMLGDLDGEFHAVDAAGGKGRWTFPAGSAIHSSANLVDGEAVFATDGGKLYRLAADGTARWTFEAGNRVNGAPAVAGGRIFLADCGAKLLAINLDGTRAASIDMGQLTGSSPLILGDRAIVGLNGGLVSAFALGDGREVWTYDKIADQSMVYSSPACAEGIVVIGARDDTVHAMDAATGAGRWTFQTRGDVDGCPVISAHRVYATSADGKLYVLDLTSGTKLWEFTAGAALSAGPAIAEGVVVIADQDGTVYCLDKP